MASTGKKGLFGKGWGSENEEVEEGADTGPADRKEIRAAFRRLPLGVHRYDPMNPPTPSASGAGGHHDWPPSMLTEKGLRELNMALSYELGFRGDLREN